MYSQDELKSIEAAKTEWENGCLPTSLEKCGITESPFRFYTPLDMGKDWSFLEKVGFPGQYPYTAGTFANSRLEAEKVELTCRPYAGYGTAEDTKEYLRNLSRRGFRTEEGPNLAFDLPTQCGYDSDDPMARGEVGKVGVAIDTLNDLEILFEDYVGDHDLDNIACNFNANSQANILLAMYVALAEKRGISPSRLNLRLQNDVLKEFVARGTYIFPIKPSLRMFRDTVDYYVKHMPGGQPVQFCGDHMREAGATADQTLGFALSNAIAYVQTLTDAGLDVDDFGPRLTFLYFKGSIEIFREIALQRAARRMWAKIMRERFKANNPESWQLRSYYGVAMKYSDTTSQRVLNNLARSLVCAVASLLSGGDGELRPPFDEPLGLGHSLEALQLKRDAERILREEAKLGSVIDPFAGSYFMESLTDEVEAKAWEIIQKIDAMGGAAASIESAYLQREIARSAYEEQKRLEAGEKVLVGVNKYLGEEELQVTVTRTVAHPYDPTKRESAEKKQLASLQRVKEERDSKKVAQCLRDLKEAAPDEDTNLVPVMVEAAKAYATLGEMCGTLREVFGEYQRWTI